ncbi:hypothetical protein [Salipiger mangrovisoli]|uniref:hypothetical protein n=1 Tax=Salipiger mangrovisoli TaxID=2865933 RepID=UPI00187E3B3C|nr:hypothetical protein [Salipiger mangrovisoli]
MEGHDLYSAVLARVSKILERGSWSDRALDRALDFLEDFVERAATGHRGGRLHSRCDEDARGETSIDMVLGGSAEAVGEHTFASAELDAKIVDTGRASFAIGSASFLAAAEGGAQYATTDAFCEVDGADFVFTKTRTVTGKNWEETTTQVFAVDFADLTLRNPLIITPESSYRVGSYQHVSDGNVAEVDFDVEVRAEHTYADVYAGALTIEDSYSGSLIEATLAIG